jgi:predicted RNA binding protein YcfA (HicA-like mRNA interferase family)
MESNSRKLIQRLEADGWTIIRITGSHHVLAKPGNPNRAVVPHPRRDLGPGLVLQIYKIAGWPKD